MREEKGREGSGEGREMRREPEDVDNGKKTYGDEGSLEEVTGGGGASLRLGVAIGDSGLKKKTRRDEEEGGQHVVSPRDRRTRKEEQRRLTICKSLLEAGAATIPVPRGAGMSRHMTDPVLPETLQGMV